MIRRIFRHAEELRDAIDIVYLEGYDMDLAGVAGWSVGDSWKQAVDPATEVELFYQKLESVVRLYFGSPEGFRRIMRHVITLNGSFFTGERLIEQYWRGAYRARGE